MARGGQCQIKRQSGPGPDRSILLYRIVDDFRHPILETVKHFKDGIRPIATGMKNGGLDYVRGHLFDPKDMCLLPPDLPGDGNDLNDLLDAQVERAKGDAKAIIFAFGRPGVLRTSRTRPSSSRPIEAPTTST